MSETTCTLVDASLGASGVQGLDKPQLGLLPPWR